MLYTRCLPVFFLAYPLHLYFTVFSVLSLPSIFPFTSFSFLPLLLPRLFFVYLCRPATMPDSAKGSSLGGRRSTAGRDSSPVRYPSPYDTTTYSREYRAYFDTDHFASLPSAGSTLTVPFRVSVRYTAAGSWRKRWKYWGGRGGLQLKAACQKMD